METLSHATLKDADEVSCSRFRNAIIVLYRMRPIRRAQVGS